MKTKKNVFFFYGRATWHWQRMKGRRRWSEKFMQTEKYWWGNLKCCQLNSTCIYQNTGTKATAHTKSCAIAYFSMWILFSFFILNLMRWFLDDDGGWRRETTNSVQNKNERKMKSRSWFNARYSRESKILLIFFLSDKRKRMESFVYL